MFRRCLLSAVALMLSTAGAARAADYQCSGTEPFWSVTVGADAIHYDDAEGAKLQLNPVAPRKADGMAEDYLAVFQTATSDSSEPYTLVIAKDDEGDCSDGMSDNKYPYSIVFISKARVLRGCCNTK